MLDPRPFAVLERTGIASRSLPPSPQGAGAVAVVALAGQDLPRAWGLLRREWPRNGLWPVAVSEALRPWTDPGPVEVPPGFEDDLGPLDLGDFANRALACAFDPITTEPRPLVHLALFATRSPWGLALALPQGPHLQGGPPSLLASRLRAWHQFHRAEVVAANDQGLEILVGRPPRTWDEALRLAKDHAEFCPRLATALGGLAPLAATLQGAPVWLFPAPPAPAISAPSPEGPLFPQFAI